MALEFFIPELLKGLTLGQNQLGELAELGDTVTDMLTG